MKVHLFLQKEKLKNKVKIASEKSKLNKFICISLEKI